MTHLLINVSIAFKGAQFWFLFIRSFSYFDEYIKLLQNVTIKWQIDVEKFYKWKRCKRTGYKTDKICYALWHAMKLNIDSPHKLLSVYCLHTRWPGRCVLLVCVSFHVNSLYYPSVSDVFQEGYGLWLWHIFIVLELRLSKFSSTVSQTLMLNTRNS